MSEMQIEAGKFYRTRDGRKVGPVSLDCRSQGDRWSWNGYVWYFDGTYRYRGSDDCDLVAPWIDDQPAPEAVKDCKHERCIERDGWGECLDCGVDVRRLHPPAPEEQIRADLKTGDVIHVRMTISELPFSGVVICHNDGTLASRGVFQRSDIVHVEPQSDPLKVGDPVRHRDYSYSGVILAIDGPQAWVKLQDDGRVAVLLSELDIAHE